METLRNQEKTKANKDHKCNFCLLPIAKGKIYLRSTHKYDGIIYDWKSHKYCNDLAHKLYMFNDCEEGVTSEDFNIYINEEYSIISGESFYSKIPFAEKLETVLSHYKINKD